MCVCVCVGLSGPTGYWRPPLGVYLSIQGSTTTLVRADSTPGRFDYTAVALYNRLAHTAGHWWSCAPGTMVAVPASGREKEVQPIGCRKCELPAE